VLLSARVGPRDIVAACCPLATAQGARPGMTLGDARALLGDAAQVLPHDPRRTQSGLRALALWAGRFSPLVSPDPDDGLMLDITGCQRALGGERAIVASLLGGLARLGVRARVCVAPSFAAAWGLVRFAPGRGTQRALHIEPDALRDALAPLPIDALRVDRATIDALGEVGIERLDQLMDAPRAVLPARFGQALLERLDAALARRPEPLDPARRAEPLLVRRTLDGPATQWEAMHLSVRAAIDQLAELLVARQRGVLRLDVLIGRAGLEPASLTLTLSRPSADRRHLWSVVRPRLESVHMGFGVEWVQAETVRDGPVLHEQSTCWREPNQPASRRAQGELVDALANRLGVQRVLHAHAAESHVPERAFAMRRLIDPVEGGLGDASATNAHDDSDPHAHHPPPRPTLLLRRPTPARVVCVAPEGPVVALDAGDGELTAQRSLGPERIEGEWWGGESWSREYFVVQDQRGRWLWLFREATSGAWWLHGLWA
jgi:protein ImuB